MATPGTPDRDARAPAARAPGGGALESGTDRFEERPPAPSHLVLEDLEQFIRAIRFGGEAAALDCARGLLDRGVPCDTIYLDLLGPAATVLGELWDEDACDFLQVTAGLGRIQRVLRGLNPAFLQAAPPAEQAGSIFLTALAGHDHTLGLFIAAEFFVRAGWAVSLGAPVAPLDFPAALRADWHDVVGFSIGGERELSRLAAEIATARRSSRNDRMKVLVGGQPFVTRPELARDVGADAVAHDAREGPAVAAGLLRAAGA